jgi:hypothetical protein
MKALFRNNLTRKSFPSLNVMKRFTGNVMKDKETAEERFYFDKEESN